ncbi:FoF1 ATP synthase subunit delta/epsilon [Pirellulaceae bacterium SH467]|jgi:F-type H+-transporting ATPase subunit epsilon
MAETQVRCVVVTPEKTELDTTCDALTLPLYDGEAGILPGRAPMVGRLGFGLLKLRNGSTSTEWFVDGGFVQVTREAVYVLTDRLLKREQIDKKQAEEDLAKATSMKASSPEAISLRERTIAQTRAKSRLAQ